MRKSALILTIFLLMSISACISQEKRTKIDTEEWWSISKERTAGEVKILYVDWSPGVFKGYQRKGPGQYTPYDLTSQYAATVFVPDTDTAPLCIYSAHTEDAVTRVNETDLAKDSQELKTIIVAYGEKSSDWETLGFGSRNHLTLSGLFLVLREDSGGERGDFAAFLSHAMTRAIDLGYAVAERHGVTVGRVGIMGGSKEGLATWLTSLEDSRVFAAAPGDFRYEDLASAVEESVREWGCNNPNPAWANAEYCHPRDFLALLEYVQRNGLEDRVTIDVADRVEELIPSFYIIHGDVNMAKTHDGKYFPLLGENAFLETLKEKGYNFRYIRHPPGGDRVMPVLKALITILSYPEVVDLWPAVEEVHTTYANGYITVRARVKGEVSEVRFVYGVSSDSAWNNGDEEWKTGAMRFERGEWVGEAYVDPQKWCALYVDIHVRTQVQGMSVDLYDASPFDIVNAFAPQSCSEPDPRFILEYIGTYEIFLV